MYQLSQTQLESDIVKIQILHSRIGEDLAKCMGFHTGNFMYIRDLNKKNIMVSVYVDILYNYNVIGDIAMSDSYNVLTMDDIESIIDDCYRELERYNI